MQLSAEEKKRQEKQRAFERADRLARKIGLTERDIAPIVAKINKHMALHGKKMLAKALLEQKKATP